MIEVQIKPQRDKITYKAEDGCSYQRQHGSTSNIDNIKRDSQLDCYRCGKPGHKADNCTLPPTVRHNRRQDTGRHDKSRQERKSGKVRRALIITNNTNTAGRPALLLRVREGGAQCEAVSQDPGVIVIVTAG